MSPLRLRHIHLPCSPGEGTYPTYKTAAALQELLRRRMLDFKDTKSSPSPARPSRPLHPTLISFTPQPTYTLGRRQAQTPQSATTAASSLSPAEILRLKAPLHIPSPPTQRHPPPADHIYHPSVLTSPRGGLATYHGPGQVVLWPVMVIRSPAPLGHRQFSVRCYSRLLEDTTIGLLRRLFGLEGFVNDDPGVWVRTPPAAAGEPLGGGGEEGEVRKVSALGIHLRRHVSSLGAAINLDMPTTTRSSFIDGVPGGKLLPPGEDERVNAWARFVACGLEGKGVTCVQEELRAHGSAGAPGISSEVVARAWAEELAGKMEMGQGGVELVEGGEVEELVRAAEREGHFDAVGRDEL